MDILALIFSIISLFVAFSFRSKISLLEDEVDKLQKTAPQSSTPAAATSAISTQLPTNREAPDPALVAFISDLVGRGTDQNAIVEALRFKGWSEGAISAAFAAVDTRSVPKSTQEVPEVYATNFFDWILVDWLQKLGGLLFVIGFGWLTTYAFINNWIGPIELIALCLVISIIFILIGFWRVRSHANQGGVFMTVGLISVLATIFSARTFYDLFTPETALALMFLAAVTTTYASVHYRVRWLAFASLIGAAGAPMLTGSPDSNFLQLFIYLFVVVVGCVWVVAITGERAITLAALIMVGLYSLPHLMQLGGRGTESPEVLLLMSFAFALVFFATNTLGILYARLTDDQSVADLVSATLTGLFVSAWIIRIAPDEWQSLLVTLWAMVFTLGSFAVYKITNNNKAFYVYGAVGVALLGIATSIEFSGPTLVIALTLEAALVTLLTMMLRGATPALRVSMIFLIPMMLSFSSMDSFAWRDSIMHADFFVLFTLAASLLGLGTFFALVKHEDSDAVQLAIGQIIVGSLYAYALLWLSLHALLDDTTAVVMSLIIYTIIGIVVYVVGQVQNWNAWRVYGGVLVGAVVVRILLVDIWNMDMAGKIVTFLVIGTLLMSTAFFQTKHNPK